MSAPSFTGVYPILPTPFHEDESLDLESMARLVRFMASLGMDGVTVLGVMGEANRLTDDERWQILRTSVEAAGGMPVIAGVTHPGTAATVALCRQAADAGIAGVMVSPSREPNPSDERVFEYFARVGADGGLPMALQDHPPSSQVFMGAPLLRRMVEEIPGVACLKLEHAPTPAKLTALWGAHPGRKVPVLMGLGALYAGFDLLRGADGFMTGFAFPEALKAMVAAARNGDQPTLLGLYTRFLPLIVYEQQPALALRKEIYLLRGLIDSPRVRHPGGQIDPVSAGEVRNLLETILAGEDLKKPLGV